jgi:hypothetical protein
MRLLAAILIVLGAIALLVPSVTFFTQERVADFGFFHIDVQKPHTIILNPAVGIVALLAGVLLLVAARGRNAPV